MFLENTQKSEKQIFRKKIYFVMLILSDIYTQKYQITRKEFVNFKYQ